MNPKSLLVNGVYSEAVGHVVEALSVCAAFRNANPCMTIAVALNANSPRQLADCVPDLRLDFIFIDHTAFESAEWDDVAPSAIKQQWDYLFVIRDQDSVSWPADRGLKRFHTLLRRHVTCLVSWHMWQPKPFGFPEAKWAPLVFKVPQASVRAANQMMPRVRSRRVCILTGSSTYGKSPSLAFWNQIIINLADAYEDIEFVLIGNLGGKYPTLNVSAAALRKLASAHERVCVAFDAGILVQLALASGSCLLIAPHSGMAFAVQCLGVPWLVISGGPFFEYFFNGVPFSCVYPTCPAYPCYHKREVMLDECREVMGTGAGIGTVRCLQDEVLSVQMPGIMSRARRLIEKRDDYSTTVTEHIEYLKKLRLSSAQVFYTRKDGFSNWI